MKTEDAIERLKDMYHSHDPFMHGRREEIAVAIHALQEQMYRKQMEENIKKLVAHPPFRKE